MLRSWNIWKNKRKHLEEPFARLPYIHPYNYPKDHAQQLWSNLFAKTKALLFALSVRPLANPLQVEMRILAKEEVARLRKMAQHHDKASPGIIPPSFDL